MLTTLIRILREVETPAAMAAGVIISLIISAFPGCGPAHRDAAHDFSRHEFLPGSTLITRVTPPPPLVLAHLRTLDNRPDYMPYSPTGVEMRVIERSFDLLPPAARNLMERRLIGLHFINNFAGSGLTEWVSDGKGTIYAFMVFNPSTLKTSISALLTAKEKSCFIHDDPEMDLRIDAGNRLSGFDYILLHESIHLMDYVMRITPYVDDSSRKTLGLSAGPTPFTEGIWRGYATAARPLPFSGKVFFYGSAPPRLGINDAPAIYRELSRSPFASLYGTLSWAEDLAELATFHHITSVLSHPYRITVFRRGTPVYSLAPLESPSVRKRLRHVAFMYESTSP